MKVVTYQIADVKPYENNPRNNDSAVDAVAASIREFGWQQPIVVDKDGVIIAGHTRYKAARKLGLAEVPVVVADKLTEEQIKAYRLADNKSGELADWDMEMLENELAGIADIDMSLFGFTEEEEKKKEKEKNGEVPFSEVLGEANNYVILQFHTEVDWIYAMGLLGIETVKSASTRKDGVVTDKMCRKGVGRVLDGVEALRRLTE